MIKEKYYKTGEEFKRKVTGKDVAKGIFSTIKSSWQKANFVYIFAFILIFYIISNNGMFNMNLADNILTASTTLGIVALGMGMIILTGDIDLSAGSTFAFTGGLGVLFYNWMKPLINNSIIALIFTMIICILIGAACSFVNGFFIGKLKMPSFIITLATMLIYRSIIQFTMANLPDKPSTFRLNGYGTDGDPFYAMGNSKLLGISIVGIIFILLVVAMFFICKYTAFGRRIYAVGSNSKAASLVGINVGWLKTIIFTIAGALIGFAAFIQIGIRGSIDPVTTGKSYELYAIASVVLGGISMAGGKGNLIGIIFGTFAFQTIDKIIAALQINAFLNDTIKGIILIIAIVFQIFKVSKGDIVKLINKTNLFFYADKYLVLDANMKKKISIVEKKCLVSVNKINNSNLPEEEIIAKINALLDKKDSDIENIKKHYEPLIEIAKSENEIHKKAEEKKKLIDGVKKTKTNEINYNIFLLSGGKGTLNKEEERKLLEENHQLKLELLKEIHDIEAVDIVTPIYNASINDKGYEGFVRKYKIDLKAIDSKYDEEKMNEDKVYQELLNKFETVNEDEHLYKQIKLKAVKEKKEKAEDVESNTSSTNAERLNRILKERQK